MARQGWIVLLSNLLTDPDEYMVRSRHAHMHAGLSFSPSSSPQQRNTHTHTIRLVDARMHTAGSVLNDRVCLLDCVLRVAQVGSLESLPPHTQQRQYTKRRTSHTHAQGSSTPHTRTRTHPTPALGRALSLCARTVGRCLLLFVWMHEDIIFICGARCHVLLC